MSEQIIGPEEAYNILKGSILSTAPGKGAVLSICKWIADWNDNLSQENKIVCYIRESINIGYVIDRNDNRFKEKKPNFMVIKLPGTDREIKQLHVDLYLRNEGYEPLKEFIYQRDSNPVRWLVTGNKLSLIGLENFITLVESAHEKRGGSS